MKKYSVSVRVPTFGPGGPGNHPLAKAYRRYYDGWDAGADDLNLFFHFSRKDSALRLVADAMQQHCMSVNITNMAEMP